MNNKLKKIYAIFDPVPLRAGQQDLYIDLDSVRGGTGVVRQLQRKIELASGPCCQLLTGHRGSGKSTELWQLQRRLQQPNGDEARYFVVLVQADDYMDRNDIDFPEILIAMIRQLAADLQERHGISLQPSYFKDRWARLKKLASTELSFDNLSLDLGMAKLSAEMKNSPDLRMELRKHLDADANNWLYAANDVIGKAKLALAKEGYQDLVIIVDGLDKMITRQHDTAGCTTTEYLFVHRAAQLTAFQCHTLYTLPLELAYSHHEPTLKDRYGGSLPVIPMTKIATPPPQPIPHPPGFAQFRKMIAARLLSVSATQQEVFENEQVETELIALSGGQPTELMTIIREAIIDADLPIQSRALRRYRDETLRSYRRQLLPMHWPVLEQAHRTGEVTRSPENEEAFHQLLASRALLLYRNDKEWYALHPVVAELSPPAPA